MHYPSTVDELVSLGWEMNANQYRLVHLAARYDDELDWFHQGFKARQLPLPVGFRSTHRRHGSGFGLARR